MQGHGRSLASGSGPHTSLPSELPGGPVLRCQYTGELEELAAVDASWRAANYLSVGQIYLLDNPLLRQPLQREHIKVVTVYAGEGREIVRPTAAWLGDGRLMLFWQEGEFSFLMQSTALSMDEMVQIAESLK